jgi:hypothetical protein
MSDIANEPIAPSAIPVAPIAPVIPVSSNIQAGIKLLEDVIVFFEAVEGGSHPALKGALDVALLVARML